MHFNAYGGNGAALAADLVNAVDHRPATLEPILTTNRILRPALTTGQATDLQRWTARLSPVFGEPDLVAQVAAINQLLADSTTLPHVSTHDGLDPHLHFFAAQADVVSRVRSVTSGGLAMAVCFSSGTRLGRCERQGCATVFVDTSRNGRRRFCSLTCANRVNVAAHRARNTSGAI